jgi:hypothetical protein
MGARHSPASAYQGVETARFGHLFDLRMVPAIIDGWPDGHADQACKRKIGGTF